MPDQSLARRLTTALGGVFLVTAVFHGVITVGRLENAYWPGGWGATTWLEPWRWVEEHVIQPSALAFTFGLITYQVLVACHLFMRGRKAEDGLIAGLVFMLLVVPVLPWPLALLNLGLAATSVWCWDTLRAERTGQPKRLPRWHTNPTAI